MVAIVLSRSRSNTFSGSVDMGLLGTDDPFSGGCNVTGASSSAIVSTNASVWDTGASIKARV